MRINVLCKRNSTAEIYDSPGGSVVKNPSAKAGDQVLIPGLGRSPGEGNGNTIQYFCLENPMNGGAWRATIHGTTKSQTQLSY